MNKAVYAPYGVQMATVLARGQEIGARSAGGFGCRCASSIPTRLATISFSLQVFTNSRYFCRLSKKRKFFFREPSVVSASLFLSPAGLLVGETRCSMDGFGLPFVRQPFCSRNLITLSQVSGVTRAPSFNLETNFPSLTERLPNVDSAMFSLLQNAEISSSRFIEAWLPAISDPLLILRSKTSYLWDAYHISKFY